jgi:ABC-type antimicrobial peptide transport system permease subunit
VITTKAQVDRASKTRLRARDLFAEAFSGLVERRGRTALTVLGATLGITAFVASLGLSRTAGSQILVRLNKLQATAVDARVTGNRSPDQISWALPDDAVARASRLNGVVSATALTSVRRSGMRIRGRLVRDLADQPSIDRDVIAASPELLTTVRGRVSSGRMFDQGNSDRADAVCVLGVRAAQVLGVGSVAGQPAIFIGEKPFLVVGVLQDVTRRTDLLDAIIIPEGIARKKFGYAGPTNLLVRTDLGAAEVVSEQLATILSPENLTRVEVRTGQQASVVRQTAARDLDALFYGLGSVVAIIGALSIANVTLVSVYERVGEIGLRRSLGARPIHIALQFLAESTFIGTLGGVFGTTLGVLAIVGISVLRKWTPVLELSVVGIAPLAGAIVGLLSGAWPSIRAAKMQPVDALRRGT